MESSEYEELTAWMMFHLTLTLNRLPQAKKIAFKNDIPKEIEELFYKLMIWGTAEANELAIKLFEGEELNIVQQVLEKDGDRYTGGINILMNYLVNNYFMEIYAAPDNRKFYLSDSPVIINDIDGIDYLLPISPKFAIAMKRFNEVNGYCISILPQPTENMMYCINSLLVKNANKAIIVSDMNTEDEEFIIKTLKEKEVKVSR